MLKNKTITITLFIFMMLSAFLVASGSNMIVDLFHSLNAMMTRANAPHFVQMHTGKVDQKEIDAFVAKNSIVKEKQIVEMIHIDGSHIHLENGPLTEKII
ncbi:hypothetical protein ACI2OX_10520 [Bacillus sp. N9]